MTKYEVLRKYLKDLLKLSSGVRVTVSLIASFILVVHTETQELKHLIRLKGFVPAMFYTTISSFLIIEFINIQNNYLNDRFPWPKVSHYRFIRQILHCLVAPILLSFICATLYFARSGILVFDTAWLSHYFLPIILLIFILNLLYVAKEAFLIIVRPQLTTTKLQLSNKDQTDEKIIKTTQLSYLLIDKNVKDICYIKSYGGTRIAFLKNGEQFAWPYTIDNSLIHLTAGKYLEINRTEIIEKTNIHEISEVDRAYFVVLKHPLENVVKVSQRQSDNHRPFFQYMKTKLAQK